MSRTLERLAEALSFDSRLECEYSKVSEGDKASRGLYLSIVNKITGQEVVVSSISATKIGLCVDPNEYNGFGKIPDRVFEGFPSSFFDRLLAIVASYLTFSKDAFAH